MGVYERRRGFGRGNRNERAKEKLTQERLRRREVGGVKPPVHLEGDVFVGDFGAGGGAELFGGGGAVIEVVAAAAG
jgi:hypothetical protein